MKILITGATGFVGAHLVRHFSNQGHEVLALGRQESPPESLLNFASWKKLNLEDEFYPDLSGDVLIHAAALASDQGDYSSFSSSNVTPTLKLYNNFKGKHFVFISSASVYPFLNKKLKEEDAELESVSSHYGRSKLEAEKLLSENIRSNCKITILRPRSIYGINDRVLLPRILKLYKKRILLLGDMDIEISMTSVKNVLESVSLTLTNQKNQFEVYNVSDLVSYQLRDVIIKLITKINQTELKVLKLPLGMVRLATELCSRLSLPFPLTQQSLDYLSKSCVLNNSKIQKDIGVKLESNFYNELDKLSEWVHEVGLAKVKSGDPKLPWLAH